MKNINYLLLLFIPLFISCSQDKNEFNDCCNSKSIKVVTRVSSRSGVVDSDIKLFNLYIDQTNDKYTYNVNMKRNYATSIWSSLDKTEKEINMMWEDIFSVNVTAVYSNNNSLENLSKSVSSNVPSIQTEDNIKLFDVLYCNKIIGNEEKKNNLIIDFTHLLSRINIIPDISTLNESGYKIKDITIQNVKTDYTWIPTDGSNSLNAIGNLNNITMLSNKDGKYECLFVPQILSDNSQIEICLQNDSGEIHMQKDKFSNNTVIKCGHSYEIQNIKIKKP